MSVYQRFYHEVRDLNGNAVAGATCKVYNAGTDTLATIYDASSPDSSPQGASNPIVTQADGVVAFFALDGQYDLQISGGGIASATQRITLSTADAGVGALLAADLASTASDALGDALVGVKQTWTGSTATTQHEVNSRIYHVRDWGVVPGADGTTGLAAALAYLKTQGGGVLLFGPGHYQKTASLTLPYGVKMRGCGREVTFLDNIAANVNGVDIESIAGGVRYASIEDMTISAKSGDTTNTAIAIPTAAGTGLAHSLLARINTNGFKYGLTGGDETWENTFDSIRVNNAISGSFRFIGSTGQGSDNVFIKCYANNVGAGATSGVSWEFSACMSKSVLIDCTWGDTSSTDSQLVVGTAVYGLAIHGGNCEGFAPANGNAAVAVSSNSVVTLNGVTFENINKPASGSNGLIAVSADAQVTVIGCSQKNAATGAGTQYSLRVSGNGAAKLIHMGCSFFSSVDTTNPGGPAIIPINGQKTVTTTTEIDLSSAGAITQVVALVNTSSQQGRLIKASLLYTVAGGGAGKVVTLGYPASPAFLATVTTNGTAQWATQDFTLSDLRIGGWGGPIVVTAAAGATATGKVLVSITYTEMG